MFTLFKKKLPQKTFKLMFDLEDNRIETLFYHKNYSEDNANKIAITLYALNNGLLFSSILESLNDTTTLDKEFVKLVISKLNYYYTLDSNNIPLIQPLETFQKNAKS